MKITIVYFLAISLAVVACAQYSQIFQEEWETYKIKFNKIYTPNEDAIRQHLYIENRLKIAEHNQRYHEGKEDFYLGVNRFSDMYPHEAFQMEEVKYNVDKKFVEGATFIPPYGASYPKSIDWREMGAVTPVKDQLHCRSSYAFATTGAMESHYFIKTGQLLSLSEQHLMDCNLLDRKCESGDVILSFLMARELGGLTTEENYPYFGENRQCNVSGWTHEVDITGFAKLQSQTEEELLQAVATVGPIAVSIDTSLRSFQAYQGGVYYEPKCSNIEPTHNALVVGYGTTDDGKDFWWVKNSWGSEWGMDGYIMMARNRDNNCGIASSASYPFVQ